MMSPFRRLALPLAVSLSLTTACRTTAPSVSSVRDEGHQPLREAAAEIAAARLTDDATGIHLTVRHAGGCGQHDYALQLGVCEGEAPLNCVVALVHRTNDSCEAFLTRDVTLPLASAGLAKPAYSRARLRLHGANDSVASITLPEVTESLPAGTTAGH